MGRPLDEDIIIKILERWQKAFKENSHYISASDLSLVIKDVRELPTIQSVATDTNVGDTISRQAAIDAIMGEYTEVHCPDWYASIIKELPSAQPEYEPADVEDFAKTMSENTLYNFMTWHNVAFTLMNEMGFVICKKTM